jgi:predicted nuclease with TOPRIM domain
MGIMGTMTDTTSCNQIQLSVDNLEFVIFRLMEKQQHHQQENQHLFELLIRQQMRLEELQSQIQGLRVENQRILAHMLR